MTVDHSLVREIEKKRQKVVENPAYFLRRSQQLKRQLRGVSNAYSFWIEHPDLRAQLFGDLSVSEVSEIRRKAKAGANQIKNAWDYLHSVGTRGSFLREFSPEVVIRVGRIIDPTKNSGGFRDGRVFLNFRNYTPPNPVKVPELISKLCEDVERSDYSPVEAAAAVHLGIAGIQPFFDGNKRTARLIQDRILADYELPPAVVPAGERILYLDLLEQALAGKRDSNYGLQRPFFDFVAGKVNVALDTILDDLKLN